MLNDEWQDMVTVCGVGLPEISFDLPGVGVGHLQLKSTGLPVIRECRPTWDEFDHPDNPVDILTAGIAGDGRRGS